VVWKLCTEGAALLFAFRGQDCIADGVIALLPINRGSVDGKSGSYVQIMLALRVSNEMDPGRHFAVCLHCYRVMFVHDVFGGGVGG
jgi:hypothetical protein